MEPTRAQEIEAERLSIFHDSVEASLEGNIYRCVCWTWGEINPLGYGTADKIHTVLLDEDGSPSTAAARMGLAIS